MNAPIIIPNFGVWRDSINNDLYSIPLQCITLKCISSKCLMRPDFKCYATRERPLHKSYLFEKCFFPELSFLEPAQLSPRAGLLWPNFIANLKK